MRNLKTILFAAGLSVTTPIGTGCQRNDNLPQTHQAEVATAAKRLIPEIGLTEAGCPGVLLTPKSDGDTDRKCCLFVETLRRETGETVTTQTACCGNSSGSACEIVPITVK